MTYGIGQKQYLVIAAGGHRGAGATNGDYVIAYALKNQYKFNYCMTDKS
jgi:glucose dehydrogenase